MNRIVYIFSCLFFLILSACQKDSDNNANLIDKNYNLFPQKKGKIMEYKVDSILFNAVKKDTISSFLREIWVDSLKNATSETRYIIERYYRHNSKENWRIKDVVSAYQTNDKLIRTEDNLQFVSLQYPLEIGKKWSSTAFFDAKINVEVSGQTLQMFKSWESIVEKTTASEKIGTATFQNVLSVYHAKDENLIEKRFALEKYAQNIGLIYKELIILDTQILNATIPIEQRAQKGFILKQTLIGY